MIVLWIVFILSVLVIGLILGALKEDLIKKDSTRSKALKTFIGSGIVAAVSFIGIVAFTVIGSSSNQTASEPSSSQTSKEASSSSTKAAKESSKAASESSDKKELEYANSMASSLRNDEKPKFAKSIGNLVENTQGKINNAVVKNDIVYITLDNSVTDGQTDMGLKQDCNTIYHAVGDIAAKHGLDVPSMFIYDSGNNTVAKNTAWGGYKYIGLG